MAARDLAIAFSGAYGFDRFEKTVAGGAAGALGCQTRAGTVAVGRRRHAADVRRAAAAIALAALTLAIAGGGAAGGGKPAPDPASATPLVPVSQPALVPVGALAATADALPPVARAPSRALGRPWDGRLEGGVALAAGSAHHFTFDSALRRSPSRRWRRYGTERLVRTVETVLARFAAEHPGAPRIGVGDLSRPRGGEFGARFGGLGHVSHQNGLDVDVYYPRRDRLERPPRHPRQVDRRLAQDLVDAFVEAGAATVFVGPRVGLRGPRGVVSVLRLHDDHLHVRLAPR